MSAAPIAERRHEIGMRIRYGLSHSRHPFIIALSAVLLVYYTIEAISFLHLNTVSPAAVLVAAVEIAAIVVLPLSPGVGCWLLGLVYPLSWWESLTTVSRGAITVGVPPRAVAELIVMYVLAVAVAAYSNLANGLAVAIVFACEAPLVTAAADAGPFGGETAELIVFLMLGLATAMAASGARLAREKAAAARVQRQRQQRITVAAQLHDHLCNELTVLLLEISQDPEFAALSKAGEYTEALQRSIDQTREIITELDGKKRKPHTPDAPPQWSVNTLQSIVERQKRHLDALGFTGMVYLNVPDGFRFPDATRARLMDDLVTELFGDIAKHADPTGGYFLSIASSPTVLTVSLSDTPRADGHEEAAAVLPPGAAGSTGLQRLRDRILALGGALDVESAPARWSLIAKIPLG